jgi:parallel beta-helix repeat protein
MARKLSHAVAVRNVGRQAVQSAVETLDPRLLFATTLTVTADVADRGVNANASFPSTSDTSIKVGDSSSVERAAVFPFKLPTLPAGAVISSVSASFRLLSLSNGSTINGVADVYGLGHRTTSAVKTTDYFEGAYGADSTDAAAIQSGLVTKTSTAGTKTLSAGGASALTNFIKGQFSAGAKAGEFVFLRINAQSNQSSNRNWLFASANTSTTANRPVIKITYDVPPPPPPADTAAISGFVWNDADSDGAVDSGESRASGATVFIDGNGNKSLDAGEKNTTADSQGVYSFTGLAAGTYKVTRVFPAGYQMSNGTGGVLPVTLVAAQQVTNANIGTAVIPPPPDVAPTAPDQLGLTTISSSSIQVVWRDNSNNETAFVVERSTDGNSFVPAGTTGANGTSFTDTGRNADTKYFYRVHAVNGTAVSTDTTIGSDTTLPAFTRTLFVDQSYTGTTTNGAFTTPYKTIAAAMATAVPGDGIVVRGGTYYESVTMKSGTPGSPITLMAEPNERSTVSGFAAVTGWQPYSGGTYSTTVNFKPDTLYVGYKAQDMSRSPNEGWYNVPTVTQDTTNAMTTVSDPAHLAGIPSLVGGYFQAHTASGNVYGGRQIVAHDTVNGTVTFAAWTGLAANDRYIIKNTTDLLDRPGEWAAVQASATTWTVYFRPVNASDLNNTQSRKSINRQIHVNGGHDIVIRGLEVTGNTKYGIELGSASGVVIRDNIIHNNGSNGVWVRYSSNVQLNHNVAMANYTGISVSSVTHVVIDGNEVALNTVDGVIVSGDVSGKQPGAVGFSPTSDVVVSNNYIHHHLGYGHADGIQMYRWVSDVHVLNNFISFNGQSVMTEEVDGAELAGNLLWNSGAYSVIFGHSNSNNWNVHNNTIGGAGYGPYNWSGVGFKMNENITIGQVSIPSITGSQYTGDRNLYFNPYSTTILRTSSPSKNYTSVATFFADTGQDEHSVAGNPLFPSAPAFAANMDVTETPNLSTLVFRNTPTGFAVGDHIQINGDGVVRTVTSVNTATKSITIDIPVPHKVLSHGWLIENWKTATSFVYDFSLPANSPGKTLGATGGPVGSQVNAVNYQAGDFNGDGQRDLPKLYSDVGLPDILNWTPPSF